MNLEQFEEKKRRERMIVAIVLSLFMVISMLVITANVIVAPQNNSNLSPNIALSVPNPSTNGVNYVGEQCFQGQSPQDHTEINGAVMAYQAGNFMFYYQYSAVNAQNGANMESGNALSAHNTVFQSLSNAGTAQWVSIHNPWFSWSGWIYSNYGQFQYPVPYHIQDNGQTGTQTCTISVTAGLSYGGVQASASASSSVTNNVYQSCDKLVHSYPQNVQWQSELNVGGQTVNVFETEVLIPFESGYHQHIDYTVIGNTTWNKQVSNWYGWGTHAQLTLSIYQISGSWITVPVSS